MSCLFNVFIWEDMCLLLRESYYIWGYMWGAFKWEQIMDKALNFEVVRDKYW